MELACACKFKGLVQGNRIQKCDGEKQSKKRDSRAGSGLGSDLKIKAMQQTKLANFNAPDNINMSKQQSDNSQCTATHSGLLSKTTLTLVLQTTLLPLLQAQNRLKVLVF